MQLGESPSVYVQHLLYRMGGRGVCEGEGGVSRFWVHVEKGGHFSIRFCGNYKYIIS